MPLRRAGDDGCLSRKILHGPSADTIRAKNTLGVSQHLRPLIRELLQLDRRDPLEDLERVGGLFDLRLQLSERDVVVLRLRGAVSGGPAGASQSPVSCGTAGRARLACVARRAPPDRTNGAAVVEPARPAPPGSAQ